MQSLIAVHRPEGLQIESPFELAETGSGFQMLSGQGVLCKV
jgi:hypothetical protein